MGPGQTSYSSGAERNVSQNRHVRKKVEALEYHADFDLGRAPATTVNLNAVDEDVAAIVLLKLVDAADQG